MNWSETTVADARGNPRVVPEFDPNAMNRGGLGSDERPFAVTGSR